MGDAPRRVGGRRPDGVPRKPGPCVRALDSQGGKGGPVDRWSWGRFFGPQSGVVSPRLNAMQLDESGGAPAVDSGAAPHESFSRSAIEGARMPIGLPPGLATGCAVAGARLRDPYAGPLARG
jgi:hypothetical protein